MGNFFQGTPHSCVDIEKRRVREYLVEFWGWWAKGTLKILHELLNHGSLGTVARVGITYLTSKCLAGAASLFWVFSDRTLNHVPVAAAFYNPWNCKRFPTKIFHCYIYSNLRCILIFSPSLYNRVVLRNENLNFSNRYQSNFFLLVI